MSWLRGLEIVKKCSRIYLEAYTSILLVPKEDLVGCRFMQIAAGFISHDQPTSRMQESFYGRDITVADRDMVETVRAEMSQRFAEANAASFAEIQSLCQIYGHL